MHKEESDLGAESQPPSTGFWARYALPDHVNDITKEVGVPPA
jgi:hypothetical protein